MPGLIRELLDRQVQALACGSGAGVLAKAETSTVPIVALSAGDPVRSGLVPSFNRPGGNVTAIALYAFSLGAKRLQLLHEVVPYARIVAVLVNPVQPDPESKADLKDVEAEAETLNQRIEVVRAASELDFNEAFAKMVDMGAGAC